MDEQRESVAEKIGACELLGPGKAERFSERLARDNGWPSAYARRVEAEYRRFLLLAATPGEFVVPSEQVDQAWHLHLLDSARYRRFCREVLGCTLDHQPGDGSASERERLSRACTRTLARYEQRFAERAPKDIWPSVVRRFGIDLEVRRVNTAEHWLLPKPRLWLWLWLASKVRVGRWPEHWPALRPRRALAALSALTLMGCGSLGLSHEVSGPSFLCGFFWLWLITYLAAFWLARRRRAMPIVHRPGVDLYGLAQLAGGEQVALESALTALITRGVISYRIGVQQFRALRDLPEGALPLEIAVYAEITAVTGVSLKELRKRARNLTLTLAATLESQGLIEVTRSVLPAWVAYSAPIWGGLRVLSRLGGDKPVLFLVLGCLFTALLGLRFFPRSQRTKAGAQLLTEARATHDGLRAGLPSLEFAEEEQIPLALALFGIMALPFSEEDPWGSELRERGFCVGSLRSVSEGGSGDGGGGGGGGGGCGGCGG
jgi:uncharacterized protein (TIGR04222 family)